MGGAYSGARPFVRLAAAAAGCTCPARCGVVNDTAMASGSGGGFYYGSSLLGSLCPYVGLSIDRLNFLVCQLVAIAAACVYRRLLPPSGDASSRSIVEIVIGVAITAFCFGHQIIHLVIMSTVCYLVMLVSSGRVLPVAVYVIATLHLSWLHINRQIHDYAGYTMDVTGPMMILLQKVTSLAFAVYDGAPSNQRKLSPDQKNQAVSAVPSVAEYYAYCFCFHNILCGPHVFYRDFHDFIHGKNVSNTHVSQSESIRTGYQDASKRVFIEKIVICLVSGAVMMFLAPNFSHYVTGTEFLEASFSAKLLYLMAILPMVRCKYYFAWTLGELVNLSAGLGFSGYDAEGVAKWDTIRSADIYGIELSTSVKDVINGWNIPTTVWLRRCVYDRTPEKWRTVAVFVCSALWHGFYPGYYFTFGTAALILFAARRVRGSIRPLVLSNHRLKQSYDLLTTILTRVAASYLGTPFILYSYEATMAFYGSMYWFLHIGALICIVVLPRTSAAVANTSPVVRPDVRASRSFVETLPSPASLTSRSPRDDDDKQG